MQDHGNQWQHIQTADGIAQNSTDEDEGSG
jgi:hypothetical protein